MNVAQLIAKLQELPQDKEVVITNWNEECFETIHDVAYSESYNHVTFSSE